MPDPRFMQRAPPSRQPDRAGHSSGQSKKAKVWTTGRNPVAVLHSAPAQARPRIRETVAKLSVVQYYDQNDYDQKLNHPNNLIHPANVDPGEYAIFVEVTFSKTFLYKPEHRAGVYTIATYKDVRPERKGPLMERFVGEREIRAKDVDHVRRIISATDMEQGMSSFDWALKVLESCAQGGYLVGNPTFPS